MASTLSLNESITLDETHTLEGRYLCGLSEHAARTLADHNKSRYHLRQIPRVTNQVLVYWPDNDESGTYDPSQKTQRVLSSKPRNEVSSGRDDDESSEDTEDESPDEDARDEHLPKKRKISSLRLARQTGASLLVVLKFTSEQGRTLFKSLAEREQEKEILRVDSKDAAPEDEVPPTSAEGLLNTDVPWLTRTRRKPAKSAGAALNGAKTQYVGIEMPRHNSQWEELMKEPAAAGCKACLEFQVECSLVEDPTTYPCDNCEMDECDCEPIVPPPRKRACESCREARARCSYRDGGDHCKPCERYQTRGFPCYAGPEERRCRFEPAAKTELFVPTEERPFLTCTPCRMAKRWCPLANKTKQPPCGPCSKQKIDCTFEKIRKAKKDAKPWEGRLQTPESRHKTPSVYSVSSSTPEPEPEPGTKTITTRLAHPILFNHQPADDDSAPCHWCCSAAFGIVGLGGPLQVNVRLQADQDGQVEVSGGYVGRGHERSRMCIDCTMDRLTIASCASHSLRRIPGVRPDAFDFDAAFAELVSGAKLSPPGGQPATLWCSICPSPAFFECITTPQATHPFEAQTEEEGVPLGCGLVLCEGCASILVHECTGSVEKMIDAVENDAEEYPLGLRADVGLLRSAGELVQFVLNRGK